MSRVSHFGLLVCITVLTACTPPAKRGDMPKLTVTGTPVLHAIDNDELRQVMGRINNLMYETNLTDQELDKQRSVAVSQVLKAAVGLEQSIDAMLAAEPKLNLDAGEHKVFASLATNLRGEAKTLKFQAESHQVDDIPQTLEKISATCTSCHELFRDFTKPGAQK